MSKRKLLLADDSVTIQKVVNLTFADEGIEVLTAGDGDTAMQMLSESRPDIVLADVHMPGANGYEICRSIRENEATRDLPVILLVGSFEPFDQGEAERVGASAYLTKPFQSIRQLVAQVSDLLGEPEEDISDLATDEPVADDPDDHDIDSLYKESITENVDAPPAEAEAPTYVDAGMDDEMIETFYAGENEPFAAFSEPLESAEVQEQRVEPGEDEAIQRDDFEIVAEPVADDAPTTDQFAMTEEIPFVPISVVQQEYSAPANDAKDVLQENGSRTAEYQFEEIDLLEIPPVGSEKTIEFTTPENAREAGSSQQVVSISPELMEMIVQRVVEKLSEKY